MTYADMFSKVKGLLLYADVSSIQEHLAFQFHVTGEAEGIFYIEVKEGKLIIEPYAYFDKDAEFICSAKTLLSIAQGNTDPLLAVASGRLKIEGNMEKAYRLKDFVTWKAEQAG